MSAGPSIFERAAAVTVTDRSPRRPAAPVVLASAHGAWCSDVDGHRYVDLTASSGAVLLGHGDPSVVGAVTDAARAGAVGLADAITEPLVDVAERLVDRYPAAERVAFFRTGSEGTTAAVRLVRAITGRRWVLSAAYHGWHDWQLGIGGFRVDGRHGIIHFGYRADALEALLGELADDVAGVIVSPEPAWIEIGTLQRMSTACSRASVPFVLDEVMTGLRFGPAGVNGSGVDADLLVLAKGLANGHSIAAVAGRDAIVGGYHEARLGGTYNREVVPLAAARAVLDATASGELHRHAGETGRALQRGIVAALTGAGVPIWSGGPPLMFDLVFADDASAELFYTTMFAKGVHMDRTGTQFITGAHGAAEVEVVITAARQAAAKVAASASTGVLSETRLLDFAYDAFGGVLAVNASWQSEVERIIATVTEAAA